MGIAFLDSKKNLQICMIFSKNKATIKKTGILKKSLTNADSWIEVIYGYRKTV